MAVKEKDFFEVQTPSSRIKANIVAEYFPQYARILLNKQQKAIRYVDLFAGPGIYKDGNFSTPLLIAKACSEDPLLKEKVEFFFNDKEYTNQLRQNFEQRFPSGTFTFDPHFGSLTVGKSSQIDNYLTKDRGPRNPYPTLLFIDPWGYKGIDTKALTKFLNGWGNELFLFVNIKRIHPALENDKFEELVQFIFPTTIDKVRRDRQYGATTVQGRLALIMNNLADEFKAGVKGPLYHCAFKFQEEDSTATSHYIIHFCKHSRGFELVKQTYSEFDNIGATLEKDGTYTFDAKKMDLPTGASLDFGDTNVAILSNLLKNEFKGRSLTAKELYDEHHTKTIFAAKHYTKALRDMEQRGILKATYNDGINHKKTVLILDSCLLEFK